jgi:hypothetical protein
MFWHQSRWNGSKNRRYGTMRLSQAWQEACRSKKGKALNTQEERAGIVHALNQPVNVIRLTIANIATRLMSKLDDNDRAYLAERLAVIEGQIERYIDITQAFEGEAAAGTPPLRALDQG